MSFGSPCVADTDISANVLVGYVSLEVANFAVALVYVELTSVVYCYSGRVVTSVFQTF